MATVTYDNQGAEAAVLGYASGRFLANAATQDIKCGFHPGKILVHEVTNASPHVHVSTILWNKNYMGGATDFGNSAQGTGTYTLSGTTTTVSTWAAGNKFIPYGKPGKYKATGQTAWTYVTQTDGLGFTITGLSESPYYYYYWEAWK